VYFKPHLASTTAGWVVVGGGSRVRGSIQHTTQVGQRFAGLHRRTLAE